MSQTGNRNRDIAEKLYIAEEKVHLKHIMTKLRAGDLTEAVAIAIRRGLSNSRLGRRARFTPRESGGKQTTPESLARRRVRRLHRPR